MNSAPQIDKARRNPGIIFVPAFLLTLLAGGLPTVRGQSDAPPVFKSIQLSNNQITAVLAVPSWVRQITLESRTNATAGAWGTAAWQQMSGTKTVTFQLGHSQPMNFLRARADAAPSFLERVRTGFGIISNSYPDAVLKAVQAGPGAATTNPNDITRLFMVCLVNGGTNTATITSTNALTFDPVQLMGYPWVGVYTLPWPITMDVMQAAILLEQAGYTGAFTKCAMSWPIYPGLNEPYYIFTMSTGPSIFVGITSHAVFPGN
jgi:hypothetical protein